MKFGVVINDADVIPLFIFPFGLRLNTEVYVQRLKKVVLSWIERVATGKLYIRSLCHAIQAGEASVGWENISATTSPFTSVRPTPQIAILMIIMRWVQSSLGPTNHRATLKMNWGQGYQ